jgi:hypothetical protein
MPEFINELTGEVTAPADYIAHLRILERTIVRLDDTIAGLQSNLKQAKQGRDAAVSDLRARSIRSRSYATDVVAGAVVAGRLVQLACQRHLNDLNRTRRRKGSSGSRTRPSASSTSSRRFSGCRSASTPATSCWTTTSTSRTRRSRSSCRRSSSSSRAPCSAGTPSKPPPVPPRLHRNGEGLRQDAVRRRPDDLPRVADGERNAQVFFAATQLDQAKIPFADAEKMVASSPSLKKRLTRR